MMLFKKFLQWIVDLLAPFPSYPVKMARTGLAIPLTRDGIDPETLRLLEPSDLQALATDCCCTCHANGHGASNICLDCGPVRFFAAMALVDRRHNTEAGS